MTSIVIDVKAGKQLRRIPLAVDVLDGEMNTVWSGSVTLGERTTVTLPDGGKYAVQARMPSGETITKTCVVEPNGEATVLFEPTFGSPRESLEWTKLSKPGALPSSAAPEQAEPSSRRDFTEEELNSIWLRLWGRRGGAPWRVLPWPVTAPDREPGVVQYTFHFRSTGQLGLYYLQIGSPSTRWRLVALPADDIRVLLVPRQEADASSGALDVTVASVDYRGDALLGYMRQGDMEHARAIAKSMLQGKVENPTVAASAAYFFLRTSNFEEFRQWMSNLASWMRWLPDGAVIDAWALLRSARPDPVRARQRLLEAASRGIPVFTAGLRLLLDGLTMLAHDKTLGNSPVKRALETVRPYGSAADWTASTTTFRGEDPQTPGKVERGMPPTLTDVVFLGGRPVLAPAARARRQANGSSSRKRARSGGASQKKAVASTPPVFQFSTVEALGRDREEPVTISGTHPLAKIVGKGVLSSGVVARRLLSYANSAPQKAVPTKGLPSRPALRAVLRKPTQGTGMSLVNEVMALVSQAPRPSKPVSRARKRATRTPSKGRAASRSRSSRRRSR